MQVLRKRPSEGVFSLELRKTRLATSPVLRLQTCTPCQWNLGLNLSSPDLQGKYLTNPLSAFSSPSTPPLGIVSLFLLLETEVCSAAQAVFKLSILLPPLLALGF